MHTTIELETEFIRLAALLKLACIVGSGGEAKARIQSGQVQVNGKTDTRRNAKIRPGDVVQIDADPPQQITVRAASPT